MQMNIGSLKNRSLWLHKNHVYTFRTRDYWKTFKKPYGSVASLKKKAKRPKTGTEGDWADKGEKWTYKI